MKHILILAPAVLALACAAVMAEETREPSAAVLKALEEIGAWDGKTESAELAGPYEDPLQQEIPFGQRSYYLVPWRAYMDTWPAQRFLDCLGINFNVSAEEADATAAVLAEAGIRSARVEVGMGSFRYDDPTQLSDPTGVRRRLEALKTRGIRPLMLLNANSGWPCPIKSHDVNLTKDAAEGAREIYLDKTDAVRPHYTGLRGMAYQVAFPLIVSVDKAAGRCELSAPLPKAIKAGRITLHTLKYPPLSFETFADGRPNAAAKETLDGWLVYVAGLCKFTKQVLGTEGAPDAGFDLEVWNELTFGSQYLEDKHYYSPAREFKKPRFTYKGKGFGYEVLLAMTVDYANDPSSGLPGVSVIDGFSNQRPWENGADMRPGQAGFSRHYYTGLNAYRPFDGNSGLVSPETDSSRRHQVLNALGKPEARMEKDQAVPGTFFIPTLRVAMPESLFHGYKTEVMVRDLQPWPNSMKGHGRYSHPGTGRHAQVWQTEFNFDRQPWAEWLLKQPGASKDDPRLIPLMEHLGAKAILRTYFFQSHKGVRTVNVFAARERETSLGVIPTAFFENLKKANYQLTDEVRALRGAQLRAVGRAAALMKTGRPIAEARPLTLAKLVEEKPRLVFRGDGTPEHPDRFHRDDFACLPYQLDAGRFAVAYYVVTRNMGHPWAKDRDLLDPARYDMPDQTFQATLVNVRGEGAKVSVYDPMTDREQPAEVLGKGATLLAVRIAAADYPRVLLIQEDRPGPLVLAPRLTCADDGSAAVAFSTNVKEVSYGTVGWGPIPGREAGGALQVRGGPDFTCKIPALPAGQGVRITVAADGLIARWPRWGYDTAGVRW
jgi:hypothetical protein